jgi:hypothetical protein
VIESLDVHVDPPSLYKAQLAVRQVRERERKKERRERDFS